VVAGLDLGGTKILGRAVEAHDPTGQLAEVRVDTPRGERAILDALAEVVRLLDADQSIVAAGGIERIGVGAAGLVDHGGVLRFAPNLPGVADLAIGPHLHDQLARPIVVDNDANCAAWCEFVLGAGVGTSDMVLVTLGTGIGAGIINRGQLQRGANGFAGEPGHMMVDPVGPPCPCGRRGCWERFASGSGLGRLARDAAAAGRADHLVELAGGDAEDVRGEHVTRAIAEGDPDALGIMRQFAWWVAVGVANLVDLLDAELVLVGGGLAQAGDVLLDPVREYFDELVLAPQQRKGVRIEAASFGSESGAIGAALLAARQ
jgi:glucokinase